MSDISTDGTDRLLGPHTVPRIECENCGTAHHIDATTGEYIGQCRDCSAFLRRPTDAEQRQFANFMDWKHRHSLRSGGESA
jgi:Zn-finger protein